MINPSKSKMVFIFCPFSSLLCHYQYLPLLQLSKLEQLSSLRVWERHLISFTLHPGILWLALFCCAWQLARWAQGKHSSFQSDNSLAALCLFTWPSLGSCKFFARSLACRCSNHQYLILAREALLCLRFWHLLSLPIFYSDCFISSVASFLARLRRVPSHLRNCARSKVDLSHCVSGIQVIEVSPWPVWFFFRLSC